MCHSRNLVAFCENCFRHNLKIEKHTFLARELHKESTMIFRLLAKNCIFEILAKTVFWPFLTRMKEISMDNETAKICCQRYLHDQKTYIKGMFSHFFLFISYFWKFMSRKPKNHYLAKILWFFFFFWEKKKKKKKSPKFSKVRNLSKKVENIP